MLWGQAPEDGGRKVNVRLKDLEAKAAVDESGVVAVPYHPFDDELPPLELFEVYEAKDNRVHLLLGNKLSGEVRDVGLDNDASVWVDGEQVLGNPLIE
jgi:hypothetical protein